AALRELDQAIGGVAYLSDRARGALERVAAHRLHGIDEQHRDVLALGGGENRLESALARHQEIAVADSEPLGAQADLPRRLLGARVEHAPAAGGERLPGVQEQRALADPRLTG